MKITLNNYEAYALDYLEGNLTLQQEVAFLHFLDKHPDIKEELVGLTDMVLVPDTSMVYPDKTRLYRKDKGGIIPLWDVSRLVAAAVALLLISSAIFFIWKQPAQSPDLVSDLQMTDDHNSQINQPTLPATRTPVPENDSSPALSDQSAGAEEPGTNVMARKGDVPGRGEKSLSSPALTSGNEVDQSRSLEVSSPVVRMDEELTPISIPNSLQRTPDIAVSEIDSKNSESKLSQENVTVSFLPEKIPSKVKSTRDVHNLVFSQSVTIKPSETSGTDSFRIHIPGEFLSDTWTDVSVAKFKKKLLPQFIKNQLNL